MTTTVPAVMLDSDVVKTAGNQTIAGVKTFSSQPSFPSPSIVRLNTANGYGSTNTAIRRFTNVVTNTGTDITYADSAGNGASFTINTTGIYAISYDDSFSGASSYHGFSLNSNQLTTSVNSITASAALAVSGDASGNYGGVCAWVGPLTAGDVIRPHCVASIATGTQIAHFTICRIA